MGTKPGRFASLLVQANLALSRIRKGLKPTLYAL
jgi:hypothetical protein